MRVCLSLAFAALCTLPTFGANLIISEVVDGTLSGGLPKFVELTNTGTTAIDLSLYSIGNQNNSNTELGAGSLALTGTLAASDSYVISYEYSDELGDGTFFTTYGFDPDFFDTGAFINGDDRIVLFEGLADGTDPVDGTGATIVDIYGYDGVDGSGETWEYTDGYAIRNASVTTSSGIFTESEWTFGGVDSLEGADDAAKIALLLANTTPGTHVTSPVPAPSSLMGLASLGLIGLNRLRRRGRKAMR
ncbi:hypothetical protein Q31b_27070 [Novipirellula aureliae]|uniref:LTD domain-containing protein n=1 Tax=Novipirellula aureliae TaxID=2527966 RepID=A0A5C6DX85_9BACT|nr:lamin tail domain-containing protein [Novipirellula aureliae]TWU41268.1 hypothetical protein Q31b_27070 [Novipirellula aureliae]